MAEKELEMEGAVEGEAEEKPKKKSKMRMLLILVGGVVILGAGGFFGWTYFMAPEEAPPQEGQAQGEQAEKTEQEEGQPGEAPPSSIMKMEPFIVNLADPGGKRYLKMSLALDTKDEKTMAEVEARIPKIRDSILLLLTSKTYQDVASVAGKIRLRNEVLKIINRDLKGDSGVHAVYFTEFVIQ